MKYHLKFEIGQTIWFKRVEKNIYQEAFIESFNEGDVDLLVSWWHGFGVKARRKIFVHEILWTIPLDNEPWPGNSMPSAPEPTQIPQIKTKKQNLLIAVIKIVNLLFNLLVCIADNWKLIMKFYFILSQILLVKEIWYNYRTTEFIECIEYYFTKDCKNNSTLWKAIEYTFSERFKLIMGTLGKGFNSFTIESLKGIHFYHIKQIFLIILQILCSWMVIYKVLGKLISLICNEILR